MKLEALKNRKFNTSENGNLSSLVGGGTTSSSSITNVNGRRDGFTDSDQGGSSTSSASIVNGIVTFDA
jgi:hypothetical protein